MERTRKTNMPQHQTFIPTKSIPTDSSQIQDIAGTSKHPTDNIYEIKKADVDNPKDAVRQSGSGDGYALFRTFVHGLDYVNELVMMADPYAIYYPLQDANYNVIAFAGARPTTILSASTSRIGGCGCRHRPARPRRGSNMSTTQMTLSYSTTCPASRAVPRTARTA